ncbi:hypothetical protein L1987_40191 [Smallanthus sonchifolius]|uniref:Uncharacterized protein n=1 Tax=Smallanthus sonchifolius TaxID=185202 RepID=A0ACB9GSL8_9ASTR|nr:hypothetical protein L1987_40191 [Smallanthus sonchifolius]
MKEIQRRSIAMEMEENNDGDGRERTKSQSNRSSALKRFLPEFSAFQFLRESKIQSLSDFQFWLKIIRFKDAVLGKMFFHIVLERNMQLHPRHFGRDLREKLVSKLMKDVEGTCSGRHGFVVAITGIENVGKGLIRDGTGFVTFPVKYQCVVFRPFKGEILEAVVSMVNKMGFFAEAGPVQIFVSNHLIPDDMEFQSGDMPNYTTSDGSVKIQKDSEVRLKIIGTRVDATEIFCIGTIKDDFLGVISDPGTTS